MGNFSLTAASAIVGIVAATQPERFWQNSLIATVVLVALAYNFKIGGQRWWSHGRCKRYWPVGLCFILLECAAVAIFSAWAQQPPVSVYANCKERPFSTGSEKSETIYEPYLADGHIPIFIVTKIGPGRGSTPERESGDTVQACQLTSYSVAPLFNTTLHLRLQNGNKILGPATISVPRIDPGPDRGTTLTFRNSSRADVILYVDQLSSTASRIDFHGPGPTDLIELKPRQYKLPNE